MWRTLETKELECWLQLKLKSLHFLLGTSLLYPIILCNLMIPSLFVIFSIPYIDFIGREITVITLLFWVPSCVFPYTVFKQLHIFTYNSEKVCIHAHNHMLFRAFFGSLWGIYINHFRLESCSRNSTLVTFCPVNLKTMKHNFLIKRRKEKYLQHFGWLS